jgi:hypothetical protein
MMFPIDEIVVTDIAGDKARVHATNSVHKSELTRIGFIGQNDDLVRPIHSVDDRLKVLVRLIELGALFSAGRDWSPEEVVQYYREQGFINGSYRVIAWKNPEQFLISTR